MGVSNCIRCIDYTSRDLVNSVYIPYTVASDMLMNYQKSAQKVLKETDAEHIVYGLKVYNNDGDLEAIQFYMLAMNEEEFHKLAARCRCAIVYALHRR